MKKTAGEVLDKADKLSDLSENLEEQVNKIDIADTNLKSELDETIDTMKNDVFDIIATQTFQDVARQKMEVIIKDMKNILDIASIDFVKRSQENDISDVRE